MRFGFITAAVLVATLGTAQAAPLFGLYNTGVDANGNDLAIGSTDTHYQYGTYGNYGFNFGPYLSGYSEGGFTSLGNAVVPTGFNWSNNTAQAQTISFGEGANSGYQEFTYRTTFDLVGVDLSDLVINYSAYFDDRGEIAVNGVLIPATALAGTGTGSLSGLFIDGINTIDFVTYNEGGPGGMQFDVTSITGGEAVPAPGALALLGLGLAGFGAMRRRKAA